MKVHVPGPLRSYTRGAAELDAAGSSVAELLSELDRRFPGIRFRVVDEQDRVRTHIRFFVNARQVFDLAHPLGPGDDFTIICALSGG
ncbi:MAG: MoaD/ThiS family protein [Candidatus Riflebacteria bacterium]|nr:MoaD/ThiS family protein [Candidatus Riflebacteria bacterium]